MEAADKGVRRPSRIAGTAFFTTAEGEFLTAAHVISDIIRGALTASPEGCAAPVVYLPVKDPFRVETFPTRAGTPSTAIVACWTRRRTLPSA